jgi:sugar (pentulose or hexulose) kinase
MDSLIAFDIGSGSIRASPARLDGTPLGSARVPTPVRSASEGAMEYDGRRILDAVLGLLPQITSEAGEDRVAGIGFSCLGTSIVAVDTDGHPVQAGLSPLDSRVPVDIPDGLNTEHV